MNNRDIKYIHKAIDQLESKGVAIIGFVGIGPEGELRVIWGTIDQEAIQQTEAKLVACLLAGFSEQKMYRADTGEEIGGENEAPPV